MPRRPSHLPPRKRPVGRPPKWRPLSELERPPYLEGLPQLPNRLAQLAGRRKLTRAEEAELNREVMRLGWIVRQARKRWEDKLERKREREAYRRLMAEFDISPRQPAVD